MQIVKFVSLYFDMFLLVYILVSNKGYLYLVVFCGKILDSVKGVQRNCFLKVLLFFVLY